MAACGAKSRDEKKSSGETSKKKAVKIKKELKTVFIKVQEVKTFHLKVRDAEPASTERSEFNKEKSKAQKICKEVLASVIKTLEGFDPAKATSPLAQKFYKDVIDQKDNYDGLKKFFNKTITPMLEEYREASEKYVKQGNRKGAVDYNSMVGELAVHLSKGYTSTYAEHSRFGRFFFEGDKKGK